MLQCLLFQRLAKRQKDVQIAEGLDCVDGERWEQNYVPFFSQLKPSCSPSLTGQPAY